MLSVGYRWSQKLRSSVKRFKHKMELDSLKYEDSVKALNQLQCIDMLPLKQRYEGMGLIAMEQFLKRVNVTDADVDKMRICHVAGTKGKGSTCAFVESILRHSGYSTGFFSSPHLVEVRERIRINGEPISPDLFAHYFWKVYVMLDDSKDDYAIKMPSYFYFLTTMAFYVFKHEAVDAVVLEVGIGGAYDCTNVIKHPAVCGITSLGIDHVNVLGNTLESIAWQKAGIFKENVPAFTIKQPDEAMKVLHDRAKELKTHLHVVPDLTSYWHRENINLSLPGDYQKINAALAVQLAYCWLNNNVLATPILLNSNFIKGLSSCQWSGRAETIKFKSITFYLDGAHTQQSIKCAAEWFNKEAANEEDELKTPCTKILAFNVTKGRSALEFLSILKFCNFSTCIFTPNIATLCTSHLNDQNNLAVSVENQLMNAVANHNDWVALSQSHHHANSHSNSLVFASIADAVCWLSKDRDMKLHDRSLQMTINPPASETCVSESTATKHLQVLVTGSLHLVGGFLRILKPNLNSP